MRFIKDILKACLLFLAIGFTIYTIFNKDKKEEEIDINKNRFVQYNDTPEYYKRYIKTSVIYKNKNHETKD